MCKIVKPVWKLQIWYNKRPDADYIGIIKYASATMCEIIDNDGRNRVPNKTKETIGTCTISIEQVLLDIIMEHY